MWNDFLNYLRHDDGELSAFWMIYVDVIQDILLGLLRASREGDWDLHLHAIRLMIPWCFHMTDSIMQDTCLLIMQK